jgi:lipoyl(octanoyl) transferase
MALDRALMESVGEQREPTTLRFYQWNPPAVSLGKGQPREAADLVRCASAGVDVVVRPTGGWAIFHTDEFTYSVSAHGEDPTIKGPLLEAYKILSSALIAGLHHLGLDASLAPAPAPVAKTGLIACFAVPYSNEITVSGKKLLGSAQTRSQRRLLQHGSLPLIGDVSRAVEYLTFTSEDVREDLRQHLREHATTASAAAGRTITYAEAADAMMAGFTEALSIELVAGDYSAEEMARATELVNEWSATGEIMVHGGR